MDGSRGRGRGRKRARARARSRKSGGASRGENIALETHPRDQVLQSSLEPPRRPGNHRTILSQLDTLHSPQLKPRRCVNANTTGLINETNVESLSRNTDTARLQLLPLTLPQPHEDAATYTPAASSGSSSHCSRKSTGPINLSNDISIGATVWTTATSEVLLDLDNVIPKISSQCQETQENQEITPGPENRPEKRTCVAESRQCISSMTRYAEQLQDEIEDDPTEVESLDPAYTIVDGHIVKKVIAPLLTEIFKKYGDITAESDYKPSEFLSLLLESLCDIYGKLEKKLYSSITIIELDRMLESVRAFELHKVKVGWLRERLEYISQTKTMSLGYKRVKEEKEKQDASIARLEKGLEDLKQKLSEERANADSSERIICETRTRVMNLLNQSLVHGLLSGTSDE